MRLDERNIRQQTEEIIKRFFHLSSSPPPSQIYTPSLSLSLSLSPYPAICTSLSTLCLPLPKFPFSFSSNSVCLSLPFRFVSLSDCLSLFLSLSLSLSLSESLPASVTFSHNILTNVPASRKQVLSVSDSEQLCKRGGRGQMGLFLLGTPTTPRHEICIRLQSYSALREGSRSEARR